MSKADNLRQKEVIDITAAEKLGRISDVEISMEDGSVTAIIVPKRGGFFARLFSRSEYIIPWESIIKVGREVVLVEKTLKINQKIS